MPELPARPDFEQLRHQAKDLLTAARSGDSEALARVGAVSERVRLAAAQLALAREYGFGSWTKLKREVQRREVLDDRDLARLRRLLAEDSTLATARMEHWCDHPRGTSPLGYVAMLRYDTARGCGGRCPAPARSSARSWRPERRSRAGGMSWRRR
jgi:hypothetical protein